MPSVSLAQSCPDTQAQAAETRPEPSVSALETALTTRIDSARAHEGLSSLESHPVLAEIAARHARDMAERAYAADVTPEGDSLLDLVRQEDRQSLYSAFGANILIAGAGASADQLHAAMMQSADNAANVRRAGFSHSGIGSVEQDGRIYVVQLFARVDGALTEPLPVQAGSAPALRTALTGARMVPVSWSVNAPDGALLLRGSGDRLRDGRGKAVEGYLNLDVAVGQDVYTLRGPFVRLD
ncbi:CAP domain-containing protein [Hyphomonas sp.]|uniref:CAP domain-containing protein n=1 Tax=Hyphomonas sp. TaxID=87 RepID=UPI00391D6BE7